jgi:FkbM family methyltransferase|tara:strand:- start:472 stop:1134 length:663 start_codon:yes stop_codon:yes gene_type:complete
MYKLGESMRLNEVKKLGIDPVTILDIGAHSGQFYSWAKYEWPDSVIWMVESNEIHESTLKNLTSGKNDEYLIAALGDEEREVTFYTRKDKPHTEGNSYYKEANYWDIPQLVLESKVKLQRLDDLFTEDTEFELIKIDTQGSELDILKGGQNLVSKSSVVILEVSYVEYNLGSPLAEDVIDYMKSINFDIYIEIGEHYSNEPQWKDVTVQKDLLFYRQESK